MKNSGDMLQKFSDSLELDGYIGNFKTMLNCMNYRGGVRITYSQLIQEVSSSQLSKTCSWTVSLLHKNQVRVLCSLFENPRE